MSIRLPFNVPRAVQAVVAALATLGAIITQILHGMSGFLPADVAGWLTGALAMIAGASGFIEEFEPVIDHTLRTA